MNEDCEDYGKRMKDMPKCQPCPENVCMACSILTLEKVLAGHARKIQLITPAGRLVTINDPEEKEQ